MIERERERESMISITGQTIISLQIQPFAPNPLPISGHSPPRTIHRTLSLRPKSPITPPIFSLKSHQTRISEKTQEDGIPIADVKILAKFKSRHNYIRVLEVSRRADHPFAGSRLLLLDGPGNIHSISFLLKSLTSTYFDVFATLPPILPPGPLGILGFGAGSAARLVLDLYPNGVIHGWELDSAVISVGREYFGLAKLEKKHPDRLFVHIGNALDAEIRDGFSGLLVDLFGKGHVIPELQNPNTWERLKGRMRRGGRIMVNVGGSCVEPEDSRRDGRTIMEETLRALLEAFPGEVSVLRLGNKKEDSSVAMTGELPKTEEWKNVLPKPLRSYADMWKPFNG
ncbi:hypothetical protein NMG60_11004491 [Bertholletia excelsa]